MKRVFVTGGGTGGHFFPALSIIELLKSRGYRVVFIGVKHGIEAKIIPGSGVDYAFIPFEGVRKRGLKGIKAILKLPFCILLAVRLMVKERPDFVISTGGYTSFPVVFASFLCGVKLYIHEQNSVSGLANRVSAIFARAVWVTFMEGARAFVKKKVIHTGNFVRSSILKSLSENSFSLRPKLSFLIMGGSAGARTINRAVLDSITDLKRMDAEFHVITGNRDYEIFRNELDKIKAKNVFVYPFVSNMEAMYSGCDVVFSRAGATTLSELSVLGKPAVLIPYPYAVEDHQRINAMIYSCKNFVWVVDNKDFNREKFIKKVFHFLSIRRYLPRAFKRCRYRIKVFKNENLDVLLEE